MKYSGKARIAAFKIIIWPVVFIVGTIGLLLITPASEGRSNMPLYVVLFLMTLVIAFTLYFFRDPEARVPQEAGLVVAPGHGKVDMIGRTTEPLFIGGECQRISIFLSVFNVHVQNAPFPARSLFTNTPPANS